LEDLIKKLEKLKAEKKKLKAKGKRVTQSSSSEIGDSSSKEEVSNKGRREETSTIGPLITLCPSITITCQMLPLIVPYQLAMLHILMGQTITNVWHCMKYYLYSIHSKVWQVVCDGVDFLDEAEQPTLDQLPKIHRSAQAISILTSSVDKEEFNCVDGLDVSKDVWVTLRLAHEGSKPVMKAKIDMLEGQLNRFIMFDDETPQDMFNRLRKLVNKVKALGSKKWTDRMLTEHLMRAYTPIYYNVVALIHQDPTYKRMTSDDVLGRIMNHEMYIEEANHIKILYKGVATTKRQEIALKANKKSKNKEVVVENSSEEEEEDRSECDAEDMALFMRKFMKYMKKKKFSKGARSLTQNEQPREYATIVVSMVISSLIAPLSMGMMTMARR
jgi:hypothetical protein